MKDTQEIIKKFNDARDWSNPKCMKDLLLNMSEEIGEKIRSRNPELNTNCGTICTPLKLFDEF